MNRTRRGAQNHTSVFTLLLPIGIAILILIVAVRAFTGSGKSDSNSPSGSSFVQVVPSDDAKATIFMSSDAGTELKGPTKMYPNDKKVRVDSGDVSIEIEGSTSKIALEKLSELHYEGVVDGKHTFTLLNGYAWVDSPNADVAINLNLFKTKPTAWTAFIAYQNTLASNAYVLKGSLDITSAKAATSLSSNQMITLLSSESENASISEKVVPLDDFIKQTNIFIKHDGSSFLASTSETESGSTSTWATTDSGSVVTSTGGKAVVFTYPEDEMTVDTQSIDIQGKIGKSNVAKITVNGKETQIFSSEKTFQLKSFSLNDATNDLAYRVYDSEGILLEKGVLTVYYSGKKPTVQKPSVTSYPISNKDFTITSPGENPYKTTEQSAKIKGSFAPNIVKYITVNNYRLKQFKEFGTSWTYNASIENGNMNEGINEYLITYYGPSDEVLATTKYIIVKEKAPEVTPTTGQTPTTTAPATTASGSDHSL